MNIVINLLRPQTRISKIIIFEFMLRTNTGFFILVNFYLINITSLFRNVNF